MKNARWDDFKVFLLVADGGSLSNAARQTGVSVPTIGRRMLALEVATGRSLFERSQSGYKLTADGDALRAKIEPMQLAAIPLEAWLSPGSKKPLVRISAGTATAGLLADNFTALVKSRDAFTLSFVTAEAVLDIAHREVEIGIRNRPAESGNLACRKLKKIVFAPYRNRHREWSGQPEWVAIDAENAVHPAAHWVLAREQISISAWANSPATLQSLVNAGAGIGVMPCFIGDRLQNLERAGEIIEELSETQWMVMHNDDRQRSEIRTVADRIFKLLEERASLLAGHRPMSG